MNETLNEKVSVISSYNKTSGLVMPRKMQWQNKEYVFKKLAYYHKKKVGNSILHVFDLADKGLDFRLVCNSDNLHWILEEVSDGRN